MVKTFNALMPLGNLLIPVKIVADGKIVFYPSRGRRSDAVVKALQEFFPCVLDPAGELEKPVRLGFLKELYICSYFDYIPVELELGNGAATIRATNEKESLGIIKELAENILPAYTREGLCGIEIFFPQESARKAA